MRLVVTSDTHYPVRHGSPLLPDGDVYIHGGDAMRTGYPDEWPLLLEWMGDLPHKTKLFVPGNHDFHMQVYPGPALQDLRRIGVTCIGLPGNHNFETFTLPTGHRILGLPYVQNLPRWAFNIGAGELRKVLQRYMEGHERMDIVVSHAPCRGYLDEVAPGKHVGSREFREFMYFMKPKYWFHGHIHEAYGHVRVPFSRDGEGPHCDIYNVAMCNREYIHTNPAAVVDL